MSCLGCKSKDADTHPDAAQVIDVNTTESAAVSRKTAQVYVGEIFRVRLPSQGGTGFTWSVEGADTNIVTLVWRGVEHATDKKSGKPTTQPGGPTFEVFDLKALRAGETKVEFVYTRPWERNVAPMKRFTLMVDVGY